MLIETLKKRISLFQEIMAISQRQLEFCQRKDLDPDNLSILLELIGQRQVFMDEIDLLNSSVLPDKDVSTGDYERRLFQYKKELHILLEKISKNDEACMKLLRGKSDELVSLIKETRVNRRVVDAYNQGGGVSEAWFLDKKR